MSLGSKGFTLIELLVVIAIIGVLAGIVLASLGNARNKGSDTNVKGTLAGLRSYAELHATNNSNVYTNICSDLVFANAVTAARNASGATAVVTAYGTTGAAGTVTCHGTTNAWAVEAPLKTGGFWCVDSTGTSTQTTGTTLGVSDAACN